MRCCSICGKELQDDMQFCPNCGAPVQMTAEKPGMNEAVFVEDTVPKKKHKGIITVIIVLALLAGAWFLHSSNVTKVNTYNKFVDLYNTMAQGTAEAENANILILKVWKNSIWKISDAETDKFTKENGGSGKFYDDFNDALACLYDDEDFTDNVAEIYAFQAYAESLIKELAKHPKAFDEEYSDFKDCYNLFVKFTDMPIYCEGSLNSFTEDHNELDKGVVDKLKELDIYFE